MGAEVEVAELERRTTVAHGRLGMRELRLHAARGRRQGLQVMTFEQLAVRLAGGLARPIDDDALREAVKSVLPETALGELDGIKALPGMVSAAADTLRKAWRAGIDLQARAGKHPRLGSVAILEAAVVQTLPRTMMRPADLVAVGRARLDHAATLFGPIEIVGITELSPVWRPLLHAIAGRVPVRWIAGPRPVPDWLDGDLIEIVQTPPQTPEVSAVSADTAYHEAVEALRWARLLIASGMAEPADIAIAAVAPADYDDHFLALRADANLDLHFVHGVKVTASREGQAAAALADIMLRGLSQTRTRRLNTLLRAHPGPFQALPEGWTRILPADSTLSSVEAWVRLLDGLKAADWQDRTDHGPALGAIIDLLGGGIEAAEETGEKLLHGRALAIWRRALAAGTAASLDLTLETLRQDDGPEACVSVCWMPASALAASPRRFVRLLGLNSARWPRGIAEDRLLSDHIVPTAELDPLPVAAADRRDFETILAITESAVVLSRSRRDEEGRLLGRSALLLQVPSDEIYLRRNAVPAHAFSETDRLTARPEEFRGLPQAAAASTCWRNWWRDELTPHDGVVRQDHPVLRAILDRTQSASSLRQFLRNPLGFVWRYGLRWRAPESGEDPLTLDALAMGDLVHRTLDEALQSLEADGGLVAAANERIAAAVASAAAEVARLWEGERAVPPSVIWRRTLDEVRALSGRALAFRDEHLPDSRAYGEVPFGGAEPKSDAVAPWDVAAPVRIPGTGLRIGGYIDRLDIAADGHHALVRDYKTGRMPKDDIVLDHGRELQRCLYAFAVKSLLGDEVSISASLLYLRDERDLRLDDADATLIALTGYLQSACANLAAGGAVMGEDTGDKYDDLAFALPANAGATYCVRKRDAATARPRGCGTGLGGTVMAGPPQALVDDAARRAAIGVHDRSFLVEAGAGSGKTAVLAGRIAMLLAEGVAPRSIAAVTFTEFAASELLIRVREFVGALAEGDIPPPLRVALPDGLSEDQRRDLVAASDALDEITCSTIHGFCQRLITPYPVEADIDPGAAVIDRNQAELAFREITDAWLREELTGEVDGLLAELVLRNPDGTVALIRTILDHFRRHRAIGHDAPEDPAPLAAAFREAADGFDVFVSDADAEEPETAVIASRFRELAEAVEPWLPAQTAADLVSLLLTAPHPDLCTKSGGFLAYRKKGKWVAAAGRAGLSRADGERLNDLASTHYARCCGAWMAVLQAVSSHVLAALIPLVRPVMDRFRDYKRATALLDFDDLIFAACDLLRDHDDVRRALAARFTRVLVDEFQDTDPLQTEIFWRLCGDPLAERDAADWATFTLRPGAIFLVGDPKQAIYRFRGADIAAYVRAREAFRAQAADGVLSIATNFRSCAPIMGYVNDRFGRLLAEENGQPGFQALDPFQPARAEGPSVAALDIAVADENGKANARQQRDGEAEAIAEICARLIGSESIRDPESGEQRPCRAGDIALLAPTGSDLWRYEEALERRGIPVATQAGKGLFQRQEIQDLIAMTRALADHRDTLALGALLRGPLVGLSEEELLDIVWALPRRDDAPDELPRLDLGVAPDAVAHGYARDVVEKLQVLRPKVNATTPHALLSQAIDVLRVRPILLQRHRGQAERALANVDLYLSFSRGYAVRGLRAFAEAMTAAWSDEARAVEGRPDAQEEAVALYTMHAAKGLEWPIVVPINTMTRVRATETAVTDRAGGRFYCSVLGVEPSGYAAARDDEKAELDRERVRLWYVAATRARELLVLPRLDVDVASTAWLSLVDLALPGLTALDLDRHPPEVGVVDMGAKNEQTREVFAAEATAIAEHQRSIVWCVPSRDEGAAGTVVRKELPAILASDGDGAPAESDATSTIQGGRERGLILHKLIEEVLSGETAETMPALVARAESLIRALGCPVTDDPAQGLAPVELAGCVVRALSLPEVAVLRPELLPEFPVYASTLTEEHEEVTTGIVDAIAFGPDGAPQVVIDWKSDVDLAPETLEHYRTQVRAYLDATGAERGLIVALTSGTVISVM